MIQVPTLAIARDILAEIARVLCAHEKTIELAAGAGSPPRVRLDAILVRDRKPVKKVLLRLESTVHLD